jgi:hypothetical protein
MKDSSLRIDIHVDRSPGQGPADSPQWRKSPKQKTTSKERRLGDEGRGSGGLVLEGSGDLLLLDVVAGEAVDTRLNKNHAELGVTVTTVALEVLADRDGLLDEVVEVLGEGGGLAARLEDTENLVAGDRLDLGDAVRVTEDNADLRRGDTALRELEDLLGDLLGGGLGPRRLRAAVGEGRSRDTLL